jgi:hypothetical protein
MRRQPFFVSRFSFLVSRFSFARCGQDGVVRTSVPWKTRKIPKYEKPDTGVTSTFPPNAAPERS